MKVTRAPNNLLNRFVDKNIVAGTPGTQLIAEDQNQLFDELLAIIDALGLTQSYTDLSQVKKSIALQVAMAQYFVDTGAANAYVINKPTNHITPSTLRTGTIVMFSPANTNTGASTINYCGLSGYTSINIKRADGNSLESGDIIANKYIMLVYDGTVFKKLDISYDNIYLSNDIYAKNLYNKNILDNGNMQINQRATAYTLVNGVYGFAVDRWAGMTEGTAVSAGTLEQKTNSTLSTSGFSVIFKNVTVTGTGISHLRQRIYSQDANIIKNKILSNGVDVLHDVGSNINYTIYLRKANALNDFTSTTDIANSGAISVTSGTATRIKFQNQNIGDCSNGLEIEYRIAHGAITTKNFEFSNAKLEIGSFCSVFNELSYQDNLLKCLAYYNKIAPTNIGFSYYPFLTGGVNLQASGFSISGRPAQFVYAFPVEMVKAPSLTLNGTWILATSGGNVTITAYAVADASKKSLSFVANDGSTLSTGFSTIFANTSGANMVFNAEL